jgi:peptide chain release factor 3
MRKTPIIIFINKLDRPGKDGFDLLDEVEQKLDLKVTPLSWPVNMGPGFKGVYNIFDKSLYLFEPGKQRIEEGISISDLDDPELDEYLDEDADLLREELELIDGVYPKFEREQYLAGSICPVFFGSALNNFGVKELLDCFIRIAPTPIGREAEERKVIPEEENFTGFVFKIHANMDPV